MEIDKSVEDKISFLIREGKAVEDIAHELNVSVYVVSFIEHVMARKEDGAAQLERLRVIAKQNVILSQNNLELRNYTAKQLAKWLIEAGLQPGQIHICTGLSIHKCRHLFQQVRSIFNTADAAIPMPQTFISRLIMSIFANHYIYLQSNSGTNSVQLSNVIVAWSRTLEEVTNSHLDEIEGFDPKLVSLGSLFDVARGLREAQPKPGEKMTFSDGKRIRKFSRSLCPNCGSYFVWFVSARRQKASHCCFCELKKAALLDEKRSKKRTQK